MADIKWIKLSVEMFDDEKIKLLESMPNGDTLIVIWCKLLTMAGKGNHGGYIMLTEQFPYTEDMLITVINRPAATVRLALSAFEKFGMIEFEESKSAFVISNWGKHQSIDGMEKIREQQRLRKQKERAKKRLPQPKTKVSRDSHAEITHGHATELEEELELEQEIDKEIDKEKEEPSSSDSISSKKQKPDFLNQPDSEHLPTNMIIANGIARSMIAKGLCTDMNKNHFLTFFDELLKNGFDEDLIRYVVFEKAGHIKRPNVKYYSTIFDEYETKSIFNRGQLQGKTNSAPNKRTVKKTDDGLWD